MGKESGRQIVRGYFEIDRTTTLENTEGLWLMPINATGAYDLLYELDGDDNIMPTEDM
jgi:hypothetical protein